MDFYVTSQTVLPVTLSDVYIGVGPTMVNKVPNTSKIAPTLPYVVIFTTFAAPIAYFFNTFTFSHKIS